MKRAGAFLAIGVALGVMIWVGLTRISTARAPNVLLISIDTLSREHVSAYGYPRSTTPTLDRLAAEGALFTDAVSTTNWTLPAHVSALSGLSPASHRVQDKPDTLPAGVRMLAEIFDEDGASTAAFVSHIYLDRKYGFDRGFHDFDNAQDQRATLVTEKAARWLAEHAGERFFLFLHYFGPHWKLEPPPEFQARFAPEGVDLARGDFRFLFQHLSGPMDAEERADVSGLYDAEIAFTDYAIGVLVDHLREAGVLDNTIVVVFSDHGEEIGEHGAFGHGTHLHREIVGVPLIVRFPARVPAGTLVAAPVSLTDIPATLLDLAGIPTPGQFLAEGSALLPEGGGRTSLDRTRVAESSRWGPKRFAVMRDGYKLMTAASYQPVAFDRHPDGTIKEFRTQPVVATDRLYHADADPAEQANLLAGAGAKGPSPEHLRIAAELRRDLQSYLDASPGLRVVCQGTYSYEGVVRHSGKLRDEPFGYPPGTGTEIRAIDDTRFGFGLKAEGAPVGVVIPLFGPDSTLSLDLKRDGADVYSGEIELPLPGETVALGTATTGCSVTVPLQPYAAGDDSVELAPEELETLRSLGYLE